MPRVISIVGATGTGKTALAVALAECLGGEVINADALQVYRGLDIGTAKPTAAERARVPHHLIDVLDPSEPFSAGEFARRARGLIEEIEARGGVPFVVGGSGLYQRALLQGLAPVPTIPPAVRRRLEERLASEGLAVLVEELERRDPETAQRLASADTQRVLRALEVHLVSGRTIGWWQSQEPEFSAISALRIGLTLPRAILYDRLRSRVSRMIDRGWLEEVERLVGRHGDASGRRSEAREARLDPAFDPATLPAFQAIGYRQLVEALREECSLDEAVESTIRETRRYAKRQETWFRRERDVHWFGAQQALTAVPEMIELFSRLGRGGS